MGFTGLIPTEYSSGTRTRRGSITKAGPEGVRTALVEAAWAYRYRPAIGATLSRRQAGRPPETLARSWKAQQRLHATWKKMTARGKPSGVAVTAVARELRRVRVGRDDQLTPSPVRASSPGPRKLAVCRGRRRGRNDPRECFERADSRRK